MLVCRDVQAMIRFYCEVLNFQVVDRMDDVGLSGWAALTRDDIQLMLTSPSYIPAPSTEEYPLDQVILYVEVNKLSDLRDEILANQYPIGATKDRFYGLREFELFDPEGHRIIFAEVIDDLENSRAVLLKAIFENFSKFVTRVVTCAVILC